MRAVLDKLRSYLASMGPTNLSVKLDLYLLVVDSPSLELFAGQDVTLWQDGRVIHQLNLYLRRTSSTANSFLLLVPWLVFYNIGLLASELQAMSGVDPVTRALFNFGGKSLFLGINFLLIVAALWVWRKGRKGEHSLTLVDPISISAEAAIYSSIVSVTVLHVLAEVPST